jgi:hypothetical protein
MDGIIMKVREGWKMGRFLCTRAVHTHTKTSWESQIVYG